MICPNCHLDLGALQHRSIPQSRYFHGVLLPILAQHEFFGGWDKEEIKFFLKEKFLGYVKGLDGVPQIIVPSESSLNTIQYEKWTSEIRQWASLPIEQGGLGCYVPSPNEGLTS